MTPEERALLLCLAEIVKDKLKYEATKDEPGFDPEDWISPWEHLYDIDEVLEKLGE